MKKLMAKFEKRPSRGALLTQWLAATLTYHISYLMSVPNLIGQLAGLSQMLEARLTTYQRLASLSGRLELLLGQSGLSNQFEENHVQVYRE
jgi:U3 small nucleolar RNA-associated protein 5